MYREKAPNARGVRRVLEAFAANVLDYEEFVGRLRKGNGIDTLLLTGNYPSDWVIDSFMQAIDSQGNKNVILLDTLPNKLTEIADVVIPAATWMEKAGTFENVNNTLQAFSRAINPIDYCKSESQIALDLEAERSDEDVVVYDAAMVRQSMADVHNLSEFVSDVSQPPESKKVESDMEVVKL